MKTPIDGARLSGRYGSRKHPVLGYTRMHKGLDFATGTLGTPIYAAGDGVIERASAYGGYGDYVADPPQLDLQDRLCPPQPIGARRPLGREGRAGTGHRGCRIDRGLATGPHLHYKVLVNGKQPNAANLKLPTGKMLTGTALAEFDDWRTAVDQTVLALHT